MTLIAFYTFGPAGFVSWQLIISNNSGTNSPYTVYLLNPPALWPSLKLISLINLFHVDILPKNIGKLGYLICFENVAGITQVKSPTSGNKLQFWSHLKLVSTTSPKEIESEAN